MKTEKHYHFDSMNWPIFFAAFALCISALSSCAKEEARLKHKAEIEKARIEQKDSEKTLDFIVPKRNNHRHV